MSRRNWRQDQRLSLRVILGLILCGAIGTTLLVFGIDKFRDHSILMERGVVVDATILNVSSKRSVTVRFSTGLKAVQVRVRDAPSGVRLVNGGKLPVRYDPADPAGRVETVGQDQAVLSRWFYLLSGAGLLGLCIYGSLWSTFHESRRRRQ